MAIVDDEARASGVKAAAEDGIPSVMADGEAHHWKSEMVGKRRCVFTPARWRQRGKCKCQMSSGCVGGERDESEACSTRATRWYEWLQGCDRKIAGILSGSVKGRLQVVSFPGCPTTYQRPGSGALGMPVMLGSSLQENGYARGRVPGVAVWTAVGGVNSRGF